MALIIQPDALAQLLAMPKKDAAWMIKALEQVASDITRRHSFVTEIVGHPGVWRLRKGVWRAFYEIVGDDVQVARFIHRRDAYK